MVKSPSLEITCHGQTWLPQWQLTPHHPWPQNEDPRLPTAQNEELSHVSALHHLPGRRTGQSREDPLIGESQTMVNHMVISADWLISFLGSWICNGIIYVYHCISIYPHG